MSDPYRSLPQPEADRTGIRERELERDVARLLEDAADLRLQVQHYKRAFNDEQEEKRLAVEEMRAKLSTYESRYGSVDKVESLYQELRQIKVAWQGALEQIERLQKLVELGR